MFPGSLSNACDGALNEWFIIPLYTEPPNSNEFFTTQYSRYSSSMALLAASFIHSHGKFLTFFFTPPSRTCSKADSLRYWRVSSKTVLPTSRPPLEIDERAADFAMLFNVALVFAENTSLTVCSIPPSARLFSTCLHTNFFPSVFAFSLAARIRAFFPLSWAKPFQALDIPGVPISKTPLTAFTPAPA